MIRAVLSRPTSVSIAALGLVVLGLFSLHRLPVSLLPTLERPRLVIEARDQGRSRDELSTQLVMPLEPRLLAIDGVRDVVVELDDGEARFTLDTEWQVDVDRLRIDVERRLTGEAITGLRALSVEIDAGDGRPILQVAVTGGTAERRSAFADKVLRPELARVPGTGRLRTVGGALRRPVITPLGAALAAHGLVPADVAELLDTVGRERPLGRLRVGATVRPLFLRQQVSSLDELGDLRLGTSGLRLRDVAEIELRRVPRAGVARALGEDAVVVEVFRAPGRNAVRLARDARRVVAELAHRAAPLTVTVVGDSSLEVVSSLRQLATAALVGLVLGVLVLRFLLGSWRPTLALAVVVPVSVIASFSAFLLAGISLDLISLAGLALAAGMLVDNSIVVLEAIAGARERRAADPVAEGSEQIAMALLASFATTAVVFLPLIYLRGLARAFFGVQAFAIVSTLLISLLLSLSLTPVLARRFGRGARPGEAERGRQPGRELYLRWLRRALGRPARPLLATALGLAAVAWLATTLPRELVPAGETSTLVAEIRLPSEVTADEAARRLEALDRRLGDALRHRPPAAPRLLLLPADERAAGPRDADGPVRLASRATLELRFSSPAELAAAWPRLAAAGTTVPGLELSFARRPSAVGAALEQTARALEVRVSASTERRLHALERRVRRALDAGGWRPEAEPADRRPAWWLRFDEARLVRLGERPTDLTAQLRRSWTPRALGRADIAGAAPEMFFDARRGLADGGPLSTPAAVRVAGRVVPLAALAALDPGGRRAVSERRTGRPTASVGVAGGLGDAAALERDLGRLERAADEGVELAGLTAELRRSFRQLRLALGLALILVFLTVAALYESLRLPLVVLVTVPTASAGALLALRLTGESFNVLSFLGLIVLTGLVVNNAIVLLHRAEQHRGAGQPAHGAVLAAAAERYRPILMTTLTTLLGLVPLALVGGDGVELRRTLAVAVAGGLVTSWAASLIVVPALYCLLLGGGTTRHAPVR